MPVDVRIDEERNLVLIDVSGPIGPDALLDHVERLRTDPRIRPGFRLWFDTSGAEPGPGIDGEFVRRVAEVTSTFGDRTGVARVAILAPADLTFGLARMFAMLVEPRSGEVRVFRQAEAARAWLCGDAGDAGRAIPER